MDVRRTGIVLKPDIARVVFRPFEPAATERVIKILGRVMSLSEQDVDVLLADVLEEFGLRHQKLRTYFLARFEAVKQHLLTDIPLTENRKLLIGSYFTQEYSLESAALFNPSLVWHPDQSNLPAGSRRFIASLRATGEGHISSITFRTGVITEEHDIRLQTPSRYVTTPETVPDTHLTKTLFRRKLAELGLNDGLAERVFQVLDEEFTLAELKAQLGRLVRLTRPASRDLESQAQSILALGMANYEISYSATVDLSERIIFPHSPTETNGIEDARFVEFRDDDGARTYYATYSAYDGKVVFPQLLETEDFQTFRMRTLNGPEVKNKGMALFPRKVGGQYCMLGRQDNENIYVMFSDQLHFWYEKKPLLKPTYPWEYVQLGNCGSPLETEAGWLVLSHGVGPMRKYSMGAFLLDLEDPTKVIGRLTQPLLEPNANEREGYVPNVVYSCGGLVMDKTLIVPYAMSDYASSFALVELAEVLDNMEKVG